MTTSAQLRRDLATLSGLAAGDLDVIWRKVTTAELAAGALFDVLPPLVATYGAAAATVAADWYDLRREQADVPKRFSAIPADIADPGTNALVGWASATATDLTSFQTLIDGGLQRRILTFSRQTVMGSSVADPSAVGWRRVGLGECDFCAMLLGRGAVYSESSADFPAHDHCRCGAEPEFV